MCTGGCYLSVYGGLLFWCVREGLVFECVQEGLLFECVRMRGVAV